MDDGILGRFTDAQIALQEVIREFYTAYGHDRISSPANRSIIYSVQTACEILVAHEERHLQQIRRIASTIMRPQA